MLRIKEWHRNFETERTATFNRRQQIDISTDITDMNLIWLLTGHKNGAAHFAVWIMLCELHAFTTKPREGWLSHNGKEDGIPLTAKDLALQIHISENIIIEALERLSSPKIGWIEETPVERSAYAAQEQSISSVSLSSSLPSSNKEEEPSTPYETSVDNYFKSKISNGMITSWRKAHPTIDVSAEILKAKAWLFSNQDRKQYSRFGRFLGNWMNSAANPPEWMREEEEFTPKYVHETLSDEDKERRRKFHEEEKRNG